MRTDRDEYKWLRDVLVSQPAVRRHLPLKQKKGLTLSHALGVVASGIALGFMLAAILQ